MHHPETFSAMLRRGCSKLPIASPMPLFVWDYTPSVCRPMSNPKVYAKRMARSPLVNDIGPKRRSQEAL